MIALADLAHYLFDRSARAELEIIPIDELAPVEEGNNEARHREKLETVNSRDLRSAFVWVNMTLMGAILLVLSAIIVSWFAFPEREVPVVLQNTVSAILGYFGGAVASYFGGGRK